MKINFENSLYDIIELNAEGNVEFNSPEFNIIGSGDNLQFEVKIEKLKVKGINSKVVTEEIEMFSDGSIEINNLTGKFSVKGKNSKLINETVFIKGESINDVFSCNGKEVTFLNVVDENISYEKIMILKMLKK